MEDEGMKPSVDDLTVGWGGEILVIIGGGYGLCLRKGEGVFVFKFGVEWRRE